MASLPPDFDSDDYGELLPGERIGPPPPSRTKGRLLMAALLAAMGGGGWGLYSGQIPWPAWLPTNVADAVAMLPKLESKSASMEPTSAMTATSAPLAKGDPLAKPVVFEPAPAAPQPGPAPDTKPTAASAPLTTGSVSPSPGAEDPVEPLPPPRVDRSDPLQVRAEAAGLHPELSRVLLERLSDADYRNAAVAIKTAIAETPDNAVLVWPRQRKPDLALFQVKFVQGAGPSCRRYVVTVTKDRWSTTALPMERCGVPPVGARRAAHSATKAAQR